MKLPSQKYRNAVAAQILNVTHWRSAWMKAEANTLEDYQAKLWYIEALEALSELGIEYTYTAEEIADMKADSVRDLELCKQRLEREAAKEAAEALSDSEATAERAAEIEQAEAEYAQLRAEVLEAEGSSVDPSDYTAVALWGEVMGSYPYYIEAEQIRASNDGAPLSAIYKRDNGRWATVHEIQNESLKAQLLAAMEEAA